MFKKIIPGKLLDQAFEGVALDFIRNNQSNIHKVIKSTDNIALQNVLGKLFELKTKKKGDIEISYIKGYIKELASLVQLDGNYYTENALIKGAVGLEPLAEVRACELMKNAYHKDMERMIIDKHYGLDYSCETLKPNEYNDTIASLTA